MYSKIIGTGRFLPEKILTNADLEKMVDTSDEWIRSRTGIEKRHVVSDGATNCDLAEGAARRAMEVAGVTAADIDMVVVATTTPDQIFPNMGCLLQERLDIHGCAAFSLEAACSGFIYGLSLVDKFVRCGDAKCVLLVGCETLTSMVDWNDRHTCVLFGDGAGAAVVAPAESPGILSTRLNADGKYKDLLYFPSGVSKGFDDLKSGRDFIQMRGNEVFRVAVKTLSRVAKETLDAAGMTHEDLTWLIPHQANIRIIQATARKLGLPMEKVVLTVAEHGNTSTASVPMALDVAVRDGRVKPGDTLLLAAFGGGFTWGSALLRY